MRHSNFGDARFSVFTIKRFCSIALYSAIAALSACGGGGGGGGSGAPSSTLPPTSSTPVVPIATVAVTTVDPLAPIPVTITNDNPNASYSAQVSLGSNVTYTLTVGASVNGVITLPAPPGAVTSVSPPSFSAGAITIAIGWPDAFGTVQYGPPISLTVNALPSIPTNFAPGTVFLTYLTATKRLLMQSSANLMAIGNLDPAIPLGIGLQNGNQTAQSVDAMTSLIQQVQADPNTPAQIGSYQGQAVTLTTSSLELLDQLTLAQMNALQVLPQTNKFSTRDGTVRSNGSAPAFTCALDDPTCWTSQLAGGARNVASVIGSSVSTICYATAGIALVVGAGPEIVTAAAIMGAVSTFATTSAGTALSAAIQGGTAAILNGTASVSDLAPSVDYFGTSILTSVVTAIAEINVVNEQSEDVQAAYNIAQTANNAAQADNSFQSFISAGLSSGQLPTSPTPVPSGTASMTTDPSTGTFTVTLNPPPPGSTQITVQQSTSSGSDYTTQTVTATNGIGGFTSPTQPNGALTVTTVSSPGGYATATTDVDSTYPSASDTTSFPSTTTTISATFSGTWSWGGPAVNGCPANDAGQFVVVINATDTAFTGQITAIGGIYGYSDTNCAASGPETDAGTMSGTVTGTAIQITSMVVPASMATLTFTGSGTLTGTTFSASIARSTGGAGQISAAAQ
jgi:hypothetical protein